jgi:hypothetical protein
VSSVLLEHVPPARRRTEIRQEAPCATINCAYLMPEQCHLEMRFTILGSTLAADLPKDLDSFFRDGILVDRRDGNPMEMDGYSAYLAFRAMEQRFRCDFSRERRRIVGALLRRQVECRGFWYHRHWTADPRETHLRFTSSAIRLLVEGWRDDLLDSTQPLETALRIHLSFYEPLGGRAKWFLHDSFELGASADAYPLLLYRNELWGSSPANSLTLNTHVDTLLTLLILHTYDPELSKTLRQQIRNDIEAGLDTLGLVLAGQARSGLLERLDASLRKAMLRFNTAGEGLDQRRRLSRRVVRRLGRLRTRAKLSRFPTFQRADGFLERDLGPASCPFYYHVCNIWDLCRLSRMLEVNGHPSGRFELLEHIVGKAVDYAFSRAYWDYTIRSCRYSGVAVALAEALSILLRRPSAERLALLKRYLEIRRLLAPSPALVGFDPSVHSLAEAERLKGFFQSSEIEANIDVIPLDEGGFLFINCSAESAEHFRFRDHQSAPERKVVALLGSFESLESGVRLEPGSAGIFCAVWRKP